MLELEDADTGDPAPDLSERFQCRHESLGIMIEQRYFEAAVVRQGVREGQVGREPEQPLPSHCPAVSGSALSVPNTWP